jgi:hypothetical protein
MMRTLSQRTMFRIKNSRSDKFVDVDTAEAIEPVIRANQPGRYHVDEISADPLPSRRTSRRWGVGIKWADGTVVIEPNPRP